MFCHPRHTGLKTCAEKRVGSIERRGTGKAAEHENTGAGGHDKFPVCSLDGSGIERLVMPCRITHCGMPDVCCAAAQISSWYGSEPNQSPGVERLKHAVLHGSVWSAGWLMCRKAGSVWSA